MESFRIDAYQKACMDRIRQRLLEKGESMLNRKKRKIGYYQRQWKKSIESFKEYVSVIEKYLDKEKWSDKEKLENIRSFIEEAPCWITEVDVYDLASLYDNLAKLKEM